MSLGVQPSTLTVTNEIEEVAVYLAVGGCSGKEIADLLEVDPDGFGETLAQKTKVAVLEANAEIGHGVRRLALAGNTTAAIFWLKTRAGWGTAAKKE